jgi:DNA ligase-1
MPLDGELWLARKSFEKTESIVSSGSQDKGWNQIKYLVFDIPDPKLGPVEKRWEILAKAVQAANRPNLMFVPQTRCRGKQHLMELLDLVCGQGAEGLMLRRPGSIYEPKRSGTILKLKKFIDDEGVVYGYETIEINTHGKEHLRGAMGALLCKFKHPKTGKEVEFKVGTGFSDSQRLNPPKIGDVITFKYQELTKDGKPRFPSFVCVRDYE